MSPRVAGMVIITATASLWQAELLWLRKAIVASFPILIASGDEGNISSATFELLLLEGSHTSEAESTLR